MSASTAAEAIYSDTSELLTSLSETLASINSESETSSILTESRNKGVVVIKQNKRDINSILSDDEESLTLDDIDLSKLENPLDLDVLSAEPIVNEMNNPTESTNIISKNNTNNQIPVLRDKNKLISNGKVNQTSERESTKRYLNKIEPTVTNLREKVVKVNSFLPAFKEPIPSRKNIANILVNDKDNDLRAKSKLIYSFKKIHLHFKEYQ